MVCVSLEARWSRHIRGFAGRTEMATSELAEHVGGGLLANVGWTLIGSRLLASLARQPLRSNENFTFNCVG